MISKPNCIFKHYLFFFSLLQLLGTKLVSFENFQTLAQMVKKLTKFKNWIKKKRKEKKKVWHVWCVFDHWTIQQQWHHWRQDQLNASKPIQRYPNKDNLLIYMYLIVAKLFEKRKEKKVHAYIQRDLVNFIILSYSVTWLKFKEKLTFDFWLLTQFQMSIARSIFKYK